MFRPNVAITRFSSESMVVVLYRIGMGMSRWWTNSSWRPTSDSSQQTYLSCTPQDSAHYRSPPPVPLKIADNKYHSC